MSFVRWFDQLGIKDVPLVGGKNASLGEMYRKLVPKGVAVPNGFAITAEAYFYLLKKAGIRDDIRRILSDLNTKDLRNLQARGRAVRQAILGADIPPDLEVMIAASYRQLERQYGKNVDVAVRSSATAEDLPDASFAGQQETYLNIRGVPMLLDACRRCFASLFTDRAISYRTDKHFDHFRVGLSIGVQKMVRSDRACSGVMFSIDTESGFRDAVLINGSWGLGENIVQGAVTPDEWYVHKPTLKKGFASIIGRVLGGKRVKMIYSRGATPTVNVPTSRVERQRFSLTDKEVYSLARWACIVEDHYRKPMDMEWAKDGITGKLFIVQARPETVQSRRDTSILEEYVLSGHGKVLCSGAPVGSKIGVGKARVIHDVSGIHQFKAGEVLVTEMTDPDWEPIMKIAAGIVTNRGGRTCHAAIVSRELGIPCIVGTNDATTNIATGRPVTVSCAEGNVGKVYEGALKFLVRKHNLRHLKRPKTKVMLNVGSPDIAFSSSFIPNDGVGLAREEFIINDQIKIHPNALLGYAKLKDGKVKRQIDALTIGYPNKVLYYVDKLAEGIGKIAAAFYPKDVIVRFSDFKTNEYANLVGGTAFEPVESNPMIGWRGSSRYYDPKFKAAFALECRAIHKVRETMGLTNLKVMVPFCRTIKEGKQVLEVMRQNGLRRGVKGLEVYVMCEIPSNVVLAEEFAKIFDGFSIGSNDLTQLTLGVDRDSELVAHIYDERNAAVKTLISQVIRAAKKHHRKIGICGQAPSDFPDFAQFLVEQGIDSISLNPDTVVKTTIAILKKERGLKK
ncbi:MAG: pyruvate, water dikinase [Parcubacteria group bacterium Gr01-1014_31]|nr:MAG: pyruvate, water dikinase [Parcubacteria group bacterium Gr01-1014_31]